MPAGLDQVVYAAAPARRTEDAYRAIYDAGLGHLIAALEAAGQTLRRLIFTSSTSVYDQRDGSWVDETSPAEAEGWNARHLRAGEERVRAAPWPGVVVRFGGIYGPGRSRLIRRAHAGEPVQRRPPLWTNRIHRDDCAGVLAHLLAVERPAPLYLAVDDRPAPLAEVVDWICDQRGWPRPPALDWAAAEDRRRGGGKRCSNRLLRASGYRFAYPDYRRGYRAL